MGSVRWSTLWFGVTSVGLLAAAWRPPSPPPRFVLANPADSRTGPACWHIAWIARPENTPEVHSATLAPLEGGDRIAVWYGGSQEAQPDVALYQAHYHDGRWSPPRAIVKAESVGPAEHRYTRRLGNPALVRDAGGRLRLFFVSTAFGGWAGSSINQMVSTDDGRTWSPPQRVISSPFFNLSTLVRSPAVSLADGGFYLPVYHEMMRKYPELLQFDADGRLVRKIRLDGQPGSLQPVLVAAGDRIAYSYLRDHCSDRARVLWQQTLDGGRHWSPAAPLDLPNPDAPVAAGRLTDDTLLLVYNPQKAGRVRLALAASRDGTTWKNLTLLEDQSHGEFSYPTLLIAGDTIDILYTWERRAIKHVRLNAAWIKEKCGG